MKYNVGDKVKIRSDLRVGMMKQMEKFEGVDVNDEMLKFRGKTDRIVNAAANGYELQTNPYIWTDDMLEDVSDDVVAHPRHYTYGTIECIDFIMDKRLDFCRGNVIKYIVRAGIKDTNELEDLKKARQYLNFAIAALEGKA